MNFKETIKEDISKVFINPEEFAEEHIIDRKLVKAVVDNDELKRRILKEFDGIIQADMLYYVSKDDISGVKVGDKQQFDRKIYTVIDVKENTGMLEIMLQGGQN